MRSVLLMAFFVAAGLRGEESTQTLMPFTFAGRAVNYDNAAFDSSSGVKMYLRNDSGDLLAQGSVFTATEHSSWNFRLATPMASKPMRGYATQGSVVELSATKDGATYSGLLKAGENMVGQPGGYVALTVMLANDTNGNGVADEYERAQEYEMFLRGIDPPYDPSADYDGDGASNYLEYLAGTDPFDKDNYFKVDAIAGGRSENGIDYVAFTFGTYPGRTYGIKSAAEPGAAAADWQRDTFLLAPSPDAAPVQRFTTGSDVWESRTIYLLKTGPSRFYRLELEQ